MVNKEKFNFDIDPRVIEYYQDRVHQIFLYLVDDCQLSCKQCLYKLDTNFYLARKDIDPKHAQWLIEDFYKMGARKLTLMGGEPTLYRIAEGNEPFFDIIERAKDIGYTYVRIDTNGQFDAKLLEHKSMKKLDEITFSLDGPTARINDPVRGKGSYERCVENIKRAVAFGYNINVTCCIHKGLVRRGEDGELPISRMAHFMDDIGVRRLNFHDIFKGGIPRDHFTGKLDISVDKWFEVWSELQKNIEEGKYSIPLRIPQSFVQPEEFEQNPSYYGYCSVKTGDRALIHPNGIIRVCSLMIGTPYGVAKFYDNKIVWDESYTNETQSHLMDKDTPCINQSKSDHYGIMKPTCVSFKPKQNEFVWKLKLDWEKYRK